jgi:ankyrin repeat protein
VNTRDDTGATALAWAVLSGNPAIVARLLKAHADPNLADANGATPLMLAIESNFPEMVRLLLDARADPDLGRPDGETPLMSAVRLNSPDMAGLLLAHGAGVNVREHKFGQTPLMWAAGHSALTRLLLDHGADVRAETRSWKTLTTNYTPVVSTIGNTGIPWNYDGEYSAASGGLSAIIFAAQAGDLESAKMLLEAGADVNQAAADGTTALLASLYRFTPNSATQDRNQRGVFGGLTFSADYAMAGFLLEHGARPNVSDRAGYTPLHGAVLSMLHFSRRGEIIIGFDGDKRNQPNAPPPKPAANEEAGLTMVRKLLDAGADPNAATSQTTPGPLGAVKINPAPPGSTPYHLAGDADSVRLIEVMAAHGANANLLRKDGHSPVSIAVMSNDLPVAEAMAAHGADLHILLNPLDKIPDPVKSVAEVRGHESLLHIAAISGANYLVPFLAARGVPLDLRNDHGETALDLADAQERFRYARAKEAAGNMDRKGTEIIRETQTSDAFRKLAASGHALPSKPS